MRTKGMSSVILLGCLMASVAVWAAKPNKADRKASQKIDTAKTEPVQKADVSTSVLFAAPPPSFEPAPQGKVPEKASLAAITYWDNGDTDGSNGYSHIAGSPRRTVLDDFVVPGGQTWYVTELQWLLLGYDPIGSGTGAEVYFRADAAGSPGAVFATANVTGYSEVATGRNWFGLDEARATADFDPVILAPGTYWVEWTPIRASNSFAMIHAAVNGSQCWVNYSDFGGLQPGSSVFGTTADFSFILGGNVLYNAHFEDDTNPIIFCIDTLSGIYGWGVGGGTPPSYTGRAEVMNGGAYIWNGPTDPNFLYVVYDSVQHRAYGYYYDTANSKFFSLFDSDTTNNVGTCP